MQFKESLLFLCNIDFKGRKFALYNICRIHMEWCKCIFFLFFVNIYYILFSILETDSLAMFLISYLSCQKFTECMGCMIRWCNVESCFLHACCTYFPFSILIYFLKLSIINNIWWFSICEKYWFGFYFFFDKLLLSSNSWFFPIV